MSKKREWPSMVTRDGKPIEVGELLFAPSVSISQYSDEKHSAAIEVYRVIDLDLRYRTMRLRCAKGCENFIDYNKSCRRSGYFATLEAAKAYLKTDITERIDEKQKELDEKQRLLASARKIKPEVWAIPAPC